MGDPQPVSCKCAADTARVSPGVKRRHRNKDKMSGKADRTSHGILLAPHSLAILLKIADDERPQSLTRTGRDIFSDFVAQNRNSYWNKDLVSGINRIDYLGWFDPQTLFVQGSEQDLEALRDAWTRRSLRPPRHFVIESLGDVCQVQLAPVSQSHFIPLPDVLCQTIAELNNGKGVATQDNIAEYLQQKFSGVPLPDQDVLHELLGELIKERKVYHNGEEYRIVTPETYTATNPPTPYSTIPPPAPQPSLPSPPEARNPMYFPPPTEKVVPMLAVPAEGHEGSNRKAGSAQTRSHSEEKYQFKRSQSMRVPAEKDRSSSLGRTESYRMGRSKSVGFNLTPKEVLQDYYGSEKSFRLFGIKIFRWGRSSKNKKDHGKGPAKQYATFSGQFPPEDMLRGSCLKQSDRRPSELTVENLHKHNLEIQKQFQDRGQSTAQTVTADVHQDNSQGDKGQEKEKPKSKHSDERHRKRRHRKHRSRRHEKDTHEATPEDAPEHVHQRVSEGNTRPNNDTEAAPAVPDIPDHTYTERLTVDAENTHFEEPVPPSASAQNTFRRTPRPVSWDGSVTRVPVHMYSTGNTGDDMRHPQQAQNMFDQNYYAEIENHQQIYSEPDHFEEEHQFTSSYEYPDNGTVVSETFSELERQQAQYRKYPHGANTQNNVTRHRHASDFSCTTTDYSQSHGYPAERWHPQEPQYSSRHPQYSVGGAAAIPEVQSDGEVEDLRKEIERSLARPNSLTNQRRKQLLLQVAESFDGSDMDSGFNSPRTRNSIASEAAMSDGTRSRRSLASEYDSNEPVRPFVKPYPSYMMHNRFPRPYMEQVEEKGESKEALNCLSTENMCMDMNNPTRTGLHSETGRQGMKSSPRSRTPEQLLKERGPFIGCTHGPRVSVGGNL
ncbi:PREDICTED: uncharacterized protein LOC109485498 [Branchiostoma belcheri]|uniref:Uncharacterized protein LOC109485498 n=1 Tax=Branchiostoma belcheri TaxID=7741 RepID=A0A6P5ARX0_BRABE|nr:PREDICTED: uncharacterized protein LOC109485498 [Branchiostoma belcheri]